MYRFKDKKKKDNTRVKPVQQPFTKIVRKQGKKNKTSVKQKGKKRLYTVQVTFFVVVAVVSYGNSIYLLVTLRSIKLQ